MNISKFTLVNGGLDGVKIEAVEKMAHEKMLFLDDVTRLRKVPLSEELREKIQNLKYFYLNLTSHWIAPFKKYFDIEEYKLLPLVTDENNEQPMGQKLLHDIWNRTRITGVTIRNGGFVITGTIEVVNNKKLGIPTPFITEEDDLSFYVTAVDKINGIMEDMATAINTRALPAPSQQMALSFGGSEEDTKTMTPEELTDLMVSRLADKGAIIMIDDDMLGTNKQLKADNNEDDVKVSTNTSSVDSHKLDVNEEEEEEDDDEGLPKEEGVPAEDDKTEYEKQTTIKAPAGSSLVSDSKFHADLNGDQAKESDLQEEKSDIPNASLEAMEHSENLGITDQQDGESDSEVNSIDKPEDQSRW